MRNLSGRIVSYPVVEYYYRSVWVGLDSSLRSLFCTAGGLQVTHDCFEHDLQPCGWTKNPVLELTSASVVGILRLQPLTIC